MKSCVRPQNVYLWRRVQKTPARLEGLQGRSPSPLEPPTVPCRQKNLNSDFTISSTMWKVKRTMEGGLPGFQTNIRRSITLFQFTSRGQNHYS
jgi:hypothetical protein